MRSLKRMVIGCCLLSSTVMAGMPDEPMDDAARLWQGIYFGVGLDYNALLYKEAINTHLVTPVLVTMDTAHLSKNISSFAPMATAGFWYAYTPYWLYGVKASYQWLNINSSRNNFQRLLPLALELNQVFSTLQIKQSASLLLMAAHPFPTWLAYIGAGPVIFSIKHNLQTSVGNTTTLATNNTGYRTVWGGALQVGFNILMPGRWAVDLSYTAEMTARYTFPSITLIGNFNPTLTWSDYLINQVFLVGLNKVISF